MRRYLLGGIALALTLACNGDSTLRRQALAAAPARRLVGTWDATFWLDRPVTLAMDRRTLPRHVAGSIAFIEQAAGDRSVEELSDLTHVGVYDIDFRSFGIHPEGVSGIPGVVARTATHGAAAPTDTTIRGPDSVSIVLDPGTRYPLRLFGTFIADTISGVWTTAQALGGGGRFSLLRHRSTP